MKRFVYPSTALFPVVPCSRTGTEEVNLKPQLVGLPIFRPLRDEQFDLPGHLQVKTSLLFVCWFLRDSVANDNYTGSRKTTRRVSVTVIPDGHLSSTNWGRMSRDGIKSRPSWDSNLESWLRFRYINHKTITSVLAIRDIVLANTWQRGGLIHFCTSDVRFRCEGKFTVSGVWNDLISPKTTGNQVLNNSWLIKPHNNCLTEFSIIDMLELYVFVIFFYFFRFIDSWLQSNCVSLIFMPYALDNAF